MLQRLVSHNDDIRRLVERGYAVGFDSECLIVRDVPYLDSEKQLRSGAVVTKLEFIDENRVKQHNHEIYFAGSEPHGLDGTRIPNLGGGPTQLGLSADDIVIERSFSNKPRSGAFVDLFEKVESYVMIISGPAMELYDVTPYTFRVVADPQSNSVFKFQDTLTSLAGIADLAERFNDDVIAVIGLGGTGAYLLDFLVKVCVREIRAFDLDRFHVHNAFRSPGKLDSNELGMTKAEVYRSRYDNFRFNLSTEAIFIDGSLGDRFDGVTFAFVCVDKGSSRAAIFDLLTSKRIPFIDVGMGLERKDGPINGMLRMAYFTPDDGYLARNRSAAPLTDRPDDVYRENIQIAELNALNAALAIIRFKQLRGFYLAKIPYAECLLELSDLKIVGDSG